MKYITCLLLLFTCQSPKPMVGYDSSPEKKAVYNKIRIKGDSNHVEIIYNWYLNKADTTKRDTL